MFGDIEDVKHQVAVKLLAQEFLDRLTAVDTEKGATVATPGPAAVLEGEKRSITDLGFPVVEVIGLRTAYNLDAESKDAAHEISVMWTQVGDDELAITTQLERLVRATRDTFWRVCLPYVDSAPIAVVSEEYSELSPRRDGSGFVKGSSTVLHVGTFAL